MKLLILTQKMNKNDPILGFFHGWTDALSRCFSSLTVISLETGEFSLQKNVRVFSLGKERKPSKIRYIFNLYRYIWKERREYDAVFVHMNQEYILLVGIVWKLLGKRIYMWRNHYAGSLYTDIAAYFCTAVFCTSKYSYTAKYKKTIIMPVGIDTSIFTPSTHASRKPRSIVSLGRISPSKNLEVLVEAAKILTKNDCLFSISVYGDPAPADVPYFTQLKKNVDEAGLSEKIIFYSGIPNHKTPEIYQMHEIFVNASKSGMYDKTILEAASCETIPLSSSKDMAESVDKALIFNENDPIDLASKIQFFLEIDFDRKKIYQETVREFVEKQHSLKALVERLHAQISASDKNSVS